MRIRLRPRSERTKVLLILVWIFGFFGALHWFYGKNLDGNSAALSGILFGGTSELYSMVMGFTIFLTWTQFDRVTTLVMQEANTMANVLRFSSKLGENGEAIRTSVMAYAQIGIPGEWKMMSDGKKDPKCEAFFDKIHDAVLSLDPKNPRETTFFHHMMRMLEDAGKYRGERLALGTSHIPKTMLYFLRSIALVLLTMLALYPGSTAIEIIASGLFAFISLFGMYVIDDFDNPFNGTFIVDYKPFLALKELNLELEAVHSEPLVPA